MSIFDAFKTSPTSTRIPPGQTETKGFPVLTYGPAPVVTREQFRLRVFGAVEQEVTLTWDDLSALPQTTQTCDIHCVTRWSKLDTVWTGVRFSDFLASIQEKCRPHGDAKWVMQHGTGGYTTNTTLAMLMDADVLIATRYNGGPIDRDHGGPVRMVVPKYYFWKSTKWLSGFEFMKEDRPGFWERAGYHNEGDPWTEERFG